MQQNIEAQLDNMEKVEVLQARTAALQEDAKLFCQTAHRIRGRRRTWIWALVAAAFTAAGITVGVLAATHQ